jgi:phage tail protein X
MKESMHVRLDQLAYRKYARTTLIFIIMFAPAV